MTVPGMRIPAGALGKKPSPTALRSPLPQAGRLVSDWAPCGPPPRGEGNGHGARGRTEKTTAFSKGRGWRDGAPEFVCLLPRGEGGRGTRPDEGSFQPLWGPGFIKPPTLPGDWSLYVCDEINDETTRTVECERVSPRPFGGEGGPPPAFSPARAGRVRGSNP